MLTFGERIKYFRNQKGFSQGELAELSGICRSSIQKYETNAAKPRHCHIVKIADALSITVDDFFACGCTSLGEKVMAYRVARGLTVRELAQIAGITPNSICLFEDGVQKPRIRQIIKLSSAFGISESCLLDGVLGAEEMLRRINEIKSDSPVKPRSCMRYSPIDVVSWKARELGVSYGELNARMKCGDLEQFATEYEEAKRRKWEMLQQEANERRKLR